ncbi:MAG TPA: translocation/assembly module TamB, partial [Caulobacteraceae bacterium]|nr:translocation/assembly module TamB [Caulobacteraceae bacterium]
MERAPRRSRLARSAIGWAIVVLLGLVVLAATARFGVLTPWGRAFVADRLDDVSVGRYGKLHVEGLDGDVWRDFSVRRLTIVDTNGPWLSADSVRIRWDFRRLFERVVAIDEVDVGKLSLVRRPVEGPQPASSGGGQSPVSLRLAKLVARVELQPAFSDRYGLYDVAGALDVKREGGLALAAHVASLTHVGDRLDAVLDLGRSKTIFLEVHGREAGGGAIAGALGLAADQPFQVDASAAGTTSQGRFHATSRSGQLVPIEGTGAWTPTGGQGQGRIVLASTRLLSGYQQMLGPALDLQIHGAKAADGFFAIDAVSHSDNADITARGEADLGRRATGPKGLAVTILAKSAKRVVGWPDMGGGRFDGGFTLRPDGWKLEGIGSIDAPTAFGYRVARIQGPMKLIGANHMLALQATADGEGGAGQGLLPALLGARPHASAELDWVAGGRVLIKSLSVA